MPERRLAKFLGELRQSEAVRKGLHSNIPTSSERHALGASHEIAFCKWAKVYFDPTFNTFKAPDVLDFIQVRGREKAHYELQVRPNEADDQAFVLCIGSFGESEIVGWAWGREAKRPEWCGTFCRWRAN